MPKGFDGFLTVVAVGEILGKKYANNEVRNQYIVTKNYMQQGPLVAASFTASQLTDIARNCHCFGILTGVRLEYLSRFIHRVLDLKCLRL